MDDRGWFEVVEGAGLRQGDVLIGCPVITLSGELPFPLPDDFAPQLVAEDSDLIVLTQSCDLENDKVEEVLVGRVTAWEAAVRLDGPSNPALKSREFRRALVNGTIPGLSLLHKHAGTPALPWSVVDFHHLHTLPKGFVEQFVAVVGPRLRLKSPYREHLAQAFARYFMRVGLPHDARAFEHEGKFDS